MNCCAAFLLTLGLAGVTAIETKIGLMASVAGTDEMLPDVAVIVAVPWPTPVARPVAEIVALLVDVQTTDPVIFCVLPSE